VRKLKPKALKLKNDENNSLSPLTHEHIGCWLHTTLRVLADRAENVEKDAQGELIKENESS
jgi:hypothetical protein